MHVGQTKNLDKKNNHNFLSIAKTYFVIEATAHPKKVDQSDILMRISYELTTRFRLKVPNLANLIF